MKQILFAAALFAAAFSCTKDNSEPIAEPATETFNAVAGIGHDFKSAVTDSKVVISQSGDAAPSFAWKKGDVIGIIPMDNKTVMSNYEIKEIGSDPKEATFDGGVWALKKGCSYAAVVPYVYNAVLCSGSLTVPFTGQTQKANNSLEHLGAFDYMYAQSTTASEDNVVFEFKHLISLVRLKIQIPATGTYTKIEISSTECEWFANKADIRLNDGNATASECSQKAEISINNTQLSEGEVFTLWFAMLPTNILNGQSLYVKLYNSTDMYMSSVCNLGSFNAGMAYSYNVSDFNQIPNPDNFVDLGLPSGLKWSPCNLGASAPHEYGSYFAFASNYAVDGNKNLLPEYDWAAKNSFNVLRTPTKADFEELMNHCTMSWTSNYNGTGVKGYVFTSKVSGFTDKSIFFPAAGIETNKTLGTGNYWTRTSVDKTQAYYLQFGSSSSPKLAKANLSGGKPIRPVYNPQ